MEYEIEKLKKHFKVYDGQLRRIYEILYCANVDQELIQNIEDNYDVDQIVEINDEIVDALIESIPEEI